MKITTSFFLVFIFCLSFTTEKEQKIYFNEFFTIKLTFAPNGYFEIERKIGGKAVANWCFESPYYILSAKDSSKGKIDGVPNPNPSYKTRISDIDSIVAISDSTLWLFYNRDKIFLKAFKKD